MPRAMNVIFPMEIIIQPNVTHIIIEYLSMLRRIYTDGHNWPIDKNPSFMGYSIGRWIDEDNGGRFDLFEVETRALKGPRAFDASGIASFASCAICAATGFIATGASAQGAPPATASGLTRK